MTLTIVRERRGAFFVYLLTLAALAMPGCAGRSDPAPIRFGHIANLSGPDKHAGDAAARGIRLAVEEINKDLDRGVGRPFLVIHSNAGDRLEAFEAEAVRLVAINRVDFLLGGTTAEEVERLDRARVSVVTPLGSRARSMSDGVYCTGLAAEQRGKLLARFAALELGVSHLVIVQDERPDSSLEITEAAAREFQAAWTKKDAKANAVIHELRWTKDMKPNELAKSLQEQIKSVEEAERAVMFAGTVAHLRELGPLPCQVLFAGTAGDGQALAALRTPGKELYFATPFDAAADAPRAREFAKRYQQAFQEQADVHAALAYEGMKLLYEAILRSKDSLNSARVREELTKLHDVEGLTGLLSFTPDRQLRRPALVIRCSEDGAKPVKRYSAEE